ncbi:MAG: dihydrolipoyl dehydrogenase [Gammaproteobacteria bacterium]|nr:dihydrolipoyl dehydrogenase [Gammaproteobacteria bacterium]
MTTSTEFDVVVIGAGPGGYVAAIRCAQLGLKTACIDDWNNADKKPSPGGTCLNVGCIPSKALIESSELYEHTLHDHAAHGIKVKDVTLDLKTMLARKDKVVTELTSGVAALFMVNKITFFHGKGVLKADKNVDVAMSDGSAKSLQAKNIIIATGSSPTELGVAPYENDTIVDSTGALAFDKVPKKLGIIGAGVIALELGSVWRRLGSEVTLFKSRNNFLPEADVEIGKEALTQFTTQGLSFCMGVKITACTVGGAGKNKKVTVEYEDEAGKQTSTFDKLIVAVGRAPNSSGVLDESSAIKIDDRGFVVVDEFCRTNVSGVYAIGDLVRGPMLAHKGSEEGVVVAELIGGHKPLPIDLDTVPSVIYTSPEIAWVGKTEQEVKAANIPFKVGKFPFSANGRARAINNTVGFIKVIAHAETDRILGVHMIGPQSSELIGQAKIAMEFGSSSEDLAMTMFAHPTLAETFHEAALSVDGRAIHAVQKKK